MDEESPAGHHEQHPLVAHSLTDPTTGRSSRKAISISMVATGFILILSFLGHSHLEKNSIKSPVPRDQTGFHFQPPRNWMNDPNGPVFYHGYYHLFYQFNPRAAVWDQNISWGHAVSTDLIHWRHLPLALQPSHSYDLNGVWSGSITMLTNKTDSPIPVIFYTGISNESVQTQNAAVPDDPKDPLLQKWRKIDENPLILPPTGIGKTDLRDPTTAWRDFPNGEWKILIGSKNGSSGVGFLYTSRDFVHWQKSDNPLFTAEGTGMWECVDFFPVSTSSSRYVLKASLGDPSIIGGVDESFDTYVIGSYFRENGTFLPQGDRISPQNASTRGLGLRYDHGNRFYASKSFLDTAKGRRVLWGWLSEADSAEEDVSKGWASVQSVPRSLWLSEEGELLQMPVEEITSLRIQPGVYKSNLSLDSGETVHVMGGSSIDIEVEFELPDVTLQMGVENFDFGMDNNSVYRLGNAHRECTKRGAGVNGILGPFGVLVLASRAREEQTAVFFHLGRTRKGLVALVCADHTKSSLRSRSSGLHGAYVELSESSMSGYKDLSLRVLVDGSVVESFAQGGRVSITSRVYPTVAKREAANVFLFNNGTSLVRVKQLSVWSMTALHFPTA